MVRTMIDYGIDLGTTNSAVAVLQGTEPLVITSQIGSSSTPSAVWIDKRGRLHVGEEAKQQRESDPDNCDIEFKLRMGLGEGGKKVFTRSGREMLPEELSAEVLKSLKADVRSNTGEDLEAAVITVPAAFDMPGCAATRRAAELAGLSHSPLLQEPVAAALAYGFQLERDKVFSLVYDFGGGTFDAAIVEVRDSVIQVVNHAGDMHLGGKLIDWDIVEELLIPALTREFSLSDFRRGNEHWRPAIAKLKNDAEKAKIEVSRKGGTSLIWIEGLCKDDSGQTIDFEYELTLEAVEKLVAPYVTKSLNLSRQALQEKRLSGGDLEKVLMVGGSSLIPSLRDRVCEELGAPLEFSIDPITVIARGAAVFAGTQRLPVGEGIPARAGTFRIGLEYGPVRSDTDPPVAGRVHHAQGGSLQGYTVEFVEVRSDWRSGKISLGEEGTFMTQVHAEKGRKCEFLIELCDPTGGRLQTAPDRFAYTVGMVITNPPLYHSVGVAMANGSVHVLFGKGTQLPARVSVTLHTERTLRGGEPGDAIVIEVVEGEDLGRPDEARLVGSLQITGEAIQKDIPAPSEVLLTFTYDESRLLTAEAYIPILDQTLELSLNPATRRGTKGKVREGVQRLSPTGSRARDLLRLQFSAFYPEKVGPEDIGMIKAYAHLEDLASEVAQEAAKRLHLPAGVKVAAGTVSKSVPQQSVIKVTPDVPGLVFDTLEATMLLWEDVQSVEFRFRPDTSAIGKVCRGSVHFWLEGRPLADVPVTIFVADERVPDIYREALAEANARPYRTVFPSYSHLDADVVELLETYARAFGDEYLRDVTKLRTGQCWKPELLAFIKRADLFQLFWSANAAASEYVEQEWRHALDERTARPDPYFVRPVYWTEELTPTPPQKLQPLDFARLPL